MLLILVQGFIVSIEGPIPTPTIDTCNFLTPLLCNRFACKSSDRERYGFCTTLFGTQECSCFHITTEPYATILQQVPFEIKQHIIEIYRRNINETLRFHRLFVKTEDALDFWTLDMLNYFIDNYDGLKSYFKYFPMEKLSETTSEHPLFDKRQKAIEIYRRTVNETFGLI